MIRSLVFLMALTWPHPMASDIHRHRPGVSVAGIQLILLARPHGRIILAGRPFWKIIQDPLGH